MIRWTSIKKHKNFISFLSIIFIFGMISGVLFYMNQDINVKKTILLNMENIFKTNIFDIKNLFIHLGVLLIIIATSFLFLSPIILIIYIFFEGISIGFIIPIFFSLYKWKFTYTFGLFFLLTKLIYLLLLMYLFFLLISFLKEYIFYLKTKKIRFFSSLKKMFLICVLIFMNDLFTYFICNKLLIFLLG